MRLNVSTTSSSAQAAILNGSVLVLIQFDVCEEIRLERLRTLRGGSVQKKPSMKNPAPAYVRYERPPVVEPLDAIQLESGERLAGEIKYYDYGVVSVVFQLPFAGDWGNLIHLASRWVWDVDFASPATPAEGPSRRYGPSQAIASPLLRQVLDVVLTDNAWYA